MTSTKNHRYQPRADAERPGQPMAAPTTPKGRDGYPCWTCHWYGYMLDGYAATCVYPGCCGVRPDAAHGCSKWTLEPFMVTGEAVPMPPPTSPLSALGRRVAAERARLEEVYSRIRGGRQPWEPRRRIIDRSGRLSEREE